MTVTIDRERPAWLRFGHDQQLDRFAASAWATHPHAPILLIFARDDEVATRQDGRQHIAVNDPHTPSRAEPFFGIVPPPPQFHDVTQALGLASAGSPRRGSRAPRPRIGLRLISKSSSLKKSSSPAAKLNCVRA